MTLLLFDSLHLSFLLVMMTGEALPYLTARPYCYKIKPVLMQCFIHHSNKESDT